MFRRLRGFCPAFIAIFVVFSALRIAVAQVPSGRSDWESGPGGFERETWSQRVLPLPDRSLKDPQRQKALLEELSRWAGLRSQMEQLKQLAEKNPDAMRALQGALSDEQRQTLEQILGEANSQRPLPIPDGNLNREGNSNSPSQQAPERRNPSRFDPRALSQKEDQPLGSERSADGADTSSNEKDLFKDVPDFEDMDPFAPLDSPNKPDAQEPLSEQKRIPGARAERNELEVPRGGREAKPSINSLGEFADRVPDSSLIAPNNQTTPPKESSGQSLQEGSAQQLQRDVRSGNVRKAFQEILAEARKESQQKRTNGASSVKPAPNSQATSDSEAQAAQLETRSDSEGKSWNGESEAASGSLPLQPENANRGFPPGALGRDAENRFRGFPEGIVPENSSSGGAQERIAGNASARRSNMDADAGEGWSERLGRFAQSLYESLATAPDATEAFDESVEDSSASEVSGASGDAYRGLKFLLQSLLGLGIVALVIWLVVRSRRIAEHEELLASNRLDWQVTSGADLVAIFHQIVLGPKSTLGPKRFTLVSERMVDSKSNHAEPWWNHRRAANSLIQRQPGNGDVVRFLAGLYERVRYSSRGDQLSEREVEQVRQALEKLRGC